MDAKTQDTKPLSSHEEEQATAKAEKSQSPKDFYERVTQREDVREILSRLANM